MVFTVTQRKNKSKTIQLFKSKNCDVIGDSKEDISPNFRYLRLPKLKIFVEMLCANLQSPVWSRDVGGALFSTNMAAGK